MRIRSNINLTPIVSPVSGQQKAEQEPKPAPTPPAPPAPRVEIDPLVIEVGNKQIELQPGELAKVVDKLNGTAKIFNYALQFEVNEGKQIVRVIDTTSGQIVREIPPEKMLEAFSRMEAALGLLIDLRV